MAKSKPLVIVESPAKIKTISKILGDGYKVMSSMGHLIDLPKSTLGVDVADGFKPKYIVVRAKQKILSQLRKEMATKKEIYIATDPDREGEAIGWHIVEEIAEDKKIYRVTFQEITKTAVLKAFKNPREFDKKKIEAQSARRILDRIVGYKISPVLWKKVGSRLSAGRVQSVALRIIVDREREIKSFVPQEYWQIAADVQKKGCPDILNAALEKIDGEKFELIDKAQTDNLVAQIQKENFVISNITQKEVRKNPAAPYITSTLQQDAFNKLGFDAHRTMRIAQDLYEGIELEGGEAVGLITYMRTDSVNISQEALTNLRGFIKEKFGEKYLPESPNVYKSKKSAQEAHEAVRPSDVLRRPEDVEKYLSEEQKKLYGLIWKRFVASQMTPAVYQNRKIEITAGKFQFGVSGSTLLFDGFLTVHLDPLEEDEGKIDLTHYEKNDPLNLVAVKPTQHFTKPPPRYSDASLVKALEEDGIGRPSTYAAIIQTLVYRNYVVRERGYFTATELGMQICDLLVEYFAKIMDIGFTAKMEEDLDRVEDGDVDSQKVLADFYGPFEQEVDFAMKNMEKTQSFIDKKCPLCSRQMMIKWGRKGKFLSCSGFPECKHAEPFTTGIKCPQPNCDGELVQRRSRRGSFYGCSRYPNCTFISNKLPEDGTSPPAQPERLMKTDKSPLAADGDNS